MNIEQRALDIIAGNELLRKNTPKVRGAIRDALIQIATEQKAEDDKECETMVGVAAKECKQVMIGKACEWLTEHTFGSDYDCAADATSTTILYHGQRLLASEFRKAMEE